VSRITRPNSCYYFASHIYRMSHETPAHELILSEKCCQQGLKSELLSSHVLIYDVNRHIMYELKRPAIRNDLWLYTNGLLFIVHALLSVRP